MSRKSMIFLCAAILVLILLAGGCAAAPAASLVPSSPPTSAVAPGEATATSSPAPTPSVAPTQTPAPSPAQTFTDPALNAAGDIPADVLRFLQSYTYDDITQFNEFFDSTVSADMDGDGRSDTVSLKAEAKKKNGEFEHITRIRVSIGSRRITIKADKGWSFGDAALPVSGTLLDLDRKDGEKELLIGAQSTDDSGNIGQASRYFLIALSNGVPKVLATIDELPEATGTGYIVGTKYSKKLAGGYSIAIQAYHRYLPGKGFEDADADTAKVMSYARFPSQGESGYPTGWDQPVAKVPGGVSTDIVPAGTPIFFGLFHTNGWIELRSADGTSLGWLDLNKVNVDKYIGNSFETSCH